MTVPSPTDYDYWATCELVAGCYAAWDAHLGSHFCPTAVGQGECEAGSEILRRLHTSLVLLDRKRALEAVRAWDWEPEAPYPKEADS
jgi:hypothetical protein